MKLITDGRPKPVHHKWIVHGQQKTCWKCATPLEGTVIRVGWNYYCDRVCAKHGPPILTRYETEVPS